MIAVIIIIIIIIIIISSSSSSIIYIANSCAFVINTMMTSINNYYYCIVCSNIFNYIPRPGLPPARRNTDVYNILSLLSTGEKRNDVQFYRTLVFNLHYWKTILSFWGPVTFQGRCCWTSGGVVKLDHFQFVGVEIKNLWNHHLSCLLLGCPRNLVDG